MPYKVLESPTGSGSLWLDDRRVADVDYRLTLIEEIKNATTLDGKRLAVPGLLSVRGFVRITRIFSAPAVGIKYQLVLADRRTCTCFLGSGSPATGVYALVVSGPIE